MSTDTTGTAVRHSVTVEASLDKAFSVFTDDIGSWWPPEHHLGQVVEMVFEPRVGGQIFDRMADGSESHWARVLGIRATDAAGVLLGREPSLANRGRPQPHERG